MHAVSSRRPILCASYSKAPFNCVSSARMRPYFLGSIMLTFYERPYSTCRCTSCGRHRERVCVCGRVTILYRKARMGLWAAICMGGACIFVAAQGARKMRAPPLHPPLA